MAMGATFLGTLIGGVSYEANAVYFDGSNDYLTHSQMSGLSDGKQFTLSFWINTTQTDASLFNLGIAFSTPSRFTVNLSSGKIVPDPAYNTSGTVILTATDWSGAINDGNWHHVIVSVDLTSTSKRFVYIDDSAYSVSWGTYTNQNIDFTRSGTNVGAASNGTTKYQGDLADFYFSTTYNDLSVESVRRQFITATGMPTGYKTDAKLFLSGDTSTWHTNQGTGGGLTENGALTDSSNLPVGL